MCASPLAGMRRSVASFGAGDGSPLGRGAIVDVPSDTIDFNLA